MTNANLSWTPSTSTDVVEQLVTVRVNGVETLTLSLPVDANNTGLGTVNPGDLVEAAIVVKNGLFTSTPTVASARVPSVPEAPTGLTITFLDS